MKREIKAEMVIQTILTHGATGAANGRIQLKTGRCFGFAHVYGFQRTADARIKEITEYLIPSWPLGRQLIPPAHCCILLPEERGKPVRVGLGGSHMSSTSAISIQRLGRLSLATLAIFVILSCSIDDPLGIRADRRATQRAFESTTYAMIRATSDALSTRAAEVHVAETAFALEVEMHAAQTEEAAAAPAPQIDAPAAPAPPGAQVGHVPAILNIDIARQIPADGTKVGGTIIFEDAAQDVVLLRAEVLAATLHAESWTYDPRQNMVWSGTRGIAAFQVWCTGDPQEVSYNFTLEDSAGNVSPAWRVDYTCK